MAGYVLRDALELICNVGLVYVSRTLEATRTQ